MNLTSTSLGDGRLGLVVGMTQCGGPAAPAEEARRPHTRLTRVGVRTMEWAPFAHSFAVQGNVETDRVANIWLNSLAWSTPCLSKKARKWPRAGHPAHQHRRAAEAAR